MCSGHLLPVLLALSLWPVAARDAHLFQLPASFLKADYDMGVLVGTLQGLVNRHAFNSSSPRANPLFVDSIELFNQFPGADRYWARYLEHNKNFTFNNLTNGGVNFFLNTVLQSAGDIIGGVVLYDGTPPEPDATRYLALTLCGLESLLPVTPALRTAHSVLASLPVRHDLRGRFATNQAAYTWALRSLLPRTNLSVAWSAGRTHLDDGGFLVWQGSPVSHPFSAPSSQALLPILACIVYTHSHADRHTCILCICAGGIVYTHSHTDRHTCLSCVRALSILGWVWANVHTQILEAAQNTSTHTLHDIHTYTTNHHSKPARIGIAGFGHCRGPLWISVQPEPQRFLLPAQPTVTGNWTHQRATAPPRVCGRGRIVRPGHGRIECKHRGTAGHLRLE